ncbi:MAG TPA: hypothetical protein VGE69_02595 [Pseudomonadales bacterium]
MSCDHEVLAAHVCDYIEGKVPPAVRARCDDALQHCAYCRDIHAQAVEFQALAGSWRDHPVPDWNRARFAVAPARQPRGSWPAWSALAASIVAIVLVLLRVEVSTANGLLISFGGAQTESRVQALVAAELERHAAAQELLLDARLADFTADQLVASQLLFSRWQETARTERRQELGLLMASWQSQRIEDRQDFNSQLTSLASDQIENNQYLNALLQNAALLRRN